MNVSVFWWSQRILGPAGIVPMQWSNLAGPFARYDELRSCNVFHTSDADIGYCALDRTLWAPHLVPGSWWLDVFGPDWPDIDGMTMAVALANVHWHGSHIDKIIRNLQISRSWCPWRQSRRFRLCYQYSKQPFSSFEIVGCGQQIQPSRLLSLPVRMFFASTTLLHREITRVKLQPVQRILLRTRFEYYSLFIIIFSLAFRVLFDLCSICWQWDGGKSYFYACLWAI